VFPRVALQLGLLDSHDVSDSHDVDTRQDVPPQVGQRDSERIRGILYRQHHARIAISTRHARHRSQSALALITDTLAATNTQRVYNVRCAQLRKIRVRVSAYTSGAIDVVIRSDTQRSLHPGINDRTSSPLYGTVTAAVGVAATLTLAAVAGLRHYIDFIRIVRSATAPLLVTTTNLPGTPVFTFGQDVAAAGVEKEVARDFGGTGLAATSPGVATTIVCPAYTGVIWRVEASYRLGV
jgi:hypothetical protein